jgi:hypothetical protein
MPLMNESEQSREGSTKEFDSMKDPFQITHTQTRRRRGRRRNPSKGEGLQAEEREA